VRRAKPAIFLAGELWPVLIKQQLDPGLDNAGIRNLIVRWAKPARHIPCE
jgi:hypothetical protein